MKVKSLSRVRLSVIPWTAAFQAPPSMGFSRQEYWNGIPLPSPLPILVTFKINTPVPLEKRLVVGPRAEAERSVEVVRGRDDIFCAHVVAKKGKSAKGHDVCSADIYLLLYVSSTLHSHLWP